MASSLLKGIGQPDQRRFAEGAAHKGDSNRQIADETGWRRDQWIARHGGRRRTSSEKVIQSGRLHLPRRRACGRNQCV